MKSMKFLRLLCGLMASLGLASTLGAADNIKSINLTPFLGTNQYKTVGADWLLPRGRQIVEGVPFRIDGVLELAGTSARFSNVQRTNINNIPVGSSFERLYVLGAASRDVKEGL